MRTHLSDEHVARRGSVGWGAVSQARDGEDGLRVERRDSLGEEDGDGISRWLSFGECCCEEIILRSLLAPGLPGKPSSQHYFRTKAMLHKVIFDSVIKTTATLHIAKFASPFKSKSGSIHH